MKLRDLRLEHLVVLLALIGDFATFITAGSLAYFHFYHGPSYYALILANIIILVWYKYNRFLAWNPKRVRRFLENARRKEARLKKEGLKTGTQ